MLFQSVTALVAFYAASASAHISMAQPVPYGKPDTSPLSPSGSNYPCKTENGFKINSVTKMAVGESQKLSFSGTAVHGGGSCQLSLTSGFTPTGSSQFKVIYSIEGGCPGTDGSTTAYDFKIPADVPAGDYTLAWTWFNRIGNREMYMNCAPITVTGGSGSQSSFSALPDMAIFNIQSKNSCGTTEGTDVSFPNPGQYVLKGAGLKAGAPTNCGAASSAPAAGSGSGSGAASGAGAAAGSASSGTPASGTSGNGSGSGTGSANNGQYTGVGASSSKPTSAAAAPQAAAPSSGSSSSPSSGGSSEGTFAEGSNGGADAGSAAGNASSPSSAPAAAAPTQAAGGSSGSSGSGAGAGASAPSAAPVTPAVATDGGSCSPDGSLVCSADGGKFGLCNWGKVIMMDVAAGTKCANGQIMRKRSFLA